MKKKLLLLVILAHVVILAFLYCNTKNKKLYRIYVQIENSKECDFNLSLSFNGKIHTQSSQLKAGYIFVGELGRKRFSDSQIEQAVNELKVELTREDGSLAVSKSFSFSDGFIVKKDKDELPERIQRNEIALFLKVARGDDGDFLLTLASPEEYE